MAIRSFIFFILVGFNFISAQNKGELKFENTSFDFGQIAYKSEAKAVFNFKNVSQFPVNIKRVSSTCGCTVPKEPKSPINPGETSEIIVLYDSTRVGPIRKTLTVYSDAVNAMITLKIIGEVLPKQ